MPQPLMSCDLACVEQWLLDSHSGMSENYRIRSVGWTSTCCQKCWHFVCFACMVYSGCSHRCSSHVCAWWTYVSLGFYFAAIYMAASRALDYLGVKFCVFWASVVVETRLFPFELLFRSDDTLQHIQLRSYMWQDTRHCPVFPWRCLWCCVRGPRYGGQSVLYLGQLSY